MSQLVPLQDVQQQRMMDKPCVSYVCLLSAEMLDNRQIPVNPRIHHPPKYYRARYDLHEPKNPTYSDVLLQERLRLGRWCNAGGTQCDQSEEDEDSDDFPEKGERKHEIHMDLRSLKNKKRPLRLLKKFGGSK